MGKRYIDRTKLKNVLLEKKLDYKHLAEQMNITLQSVYRKMSGAEFTEQEIQYLVEKFGNKILIK